MFFAFKMYSFWFLDFVKKFLLLSVFSCANKLLSDTPNGFLTKTIGRFATMRVERYVGTRCAVHGVTEPSC